MVPAILSGAAALPSRPTIAGFACIGGRHANAKSWTSAGNAGLLEMNLNAMLENHASVGRISYATRNSMM
jgi:hypothetical protein